MTNEPFVLAPWELSPGSPETLEGVATACLPIQFQGEEQVVLVREVRGVSRGVESLVFVRRVDDPREGNWVPLGRHRLWPEAEYPVGKFGYGWRGRVEVPDYGRVFWVGENMAVLRANGRAAWTTSYTRSSQAPQIPFRWHDGTHDWTQEPTRTWKDALDTALQDDFSDARFAYNWCSISSDEHGELAWNCTGGWPKLRTLMNQMLLAHPLFAQCEEYDVRLGYDMGRRFKVHFDPNVADPRKTELDTAWSFTLNTFFCVIRNRKLRRRHPCINESFPLEHVYSRQGYSLELKCDSISFHERLEAKLELQTWARRRGIQTPLEHDEFLKLEEWETIPSALDVEPRLVTVRTRRRWWGKSWDVLLSQVEVRPEYNLTFVRPLSGDGNGNFVLCEHDEETGDLRPRAPHVRAELAPTWHALLHKSDLARFIALDLEQWVEAGRGFALLQPNGVGYFHWWAEETMPEDYDRKIEVFRWNSHGLENASAHEWKRRLEAELSDATSDIRFALRWMHLSDNERMQQVFRCQRGNGEELLRVLQWALKCDPMFAQSRCYKRRQTTYHEEWGWSPWPDQEVTSYMFSQTKPLSRHLKKWRAAIWDWFGPVLDEELQQKHPCVVRFLHHPYRTVFQLNVSPLTPRKQQRAALPLRHWARGKVPDELLQTLDTLVAKKNPKRKEEPGKLR